MTDTASILKSIVSLFIIGIIIYVIIAFHKVFGQILNDIEKLGHTTFQAIGSMLEKLTCCTTGCPGSKTPCSASSIKAMKNQIGYNLCSNCTPPCKLKSYDSGPSCTEWTFIGLFGLLTYTGFFGWLLKKMKRDNTKKAMDDPDLAAAEANDVDVLDLVDIGEKDNILDEADFKEFNTDKTNEDDKAEMRKFMKKEPNTLKEGDIPKSIKDKYKLEGDPLVERCKQRIIQRTKARESLVNHALKKKLKALKGPSDKTLNDILQKDLTNIENEWKDGKGDDGKDGKDGKDGDDYNDDVNNDFHEPV